MGALLTLQEVALRLRTPEATLRYWRHIGKGPLGVRYGRRVLYDERDLELWVERQRSDAIQGIGTSVA